MTAYPQKAWQVAVETAYRNKARRGFLTHLLFYLAFNTFFITLNLKTAPEFHWFLFPLLFWGIFLLFHGAMATFLAPMNARRFYGEVLSQLEGEA